MIRLVRPPFNIDLYIDQMSHRSHDQLTGHSDKLDFDQPYNVLIIILFAVR